MSLPLIDIVPQLRGMLSKPRALGPALGISAASGVLEGLALAALLPAITALAQDSAVWGLTISGWLAVFIVLSLLSFIGNYYLNRWNYDVALDFLRTFQRGVGLQVARLPLGWFRKSAAGKLSRMVSTELMSTGEVFAHMLGPLFSRLVSAVVILVAAWFWEPLLGLTLTLAVPVVVIAVLCSTAILRAAARSHEPHEVELAHRIVEYAQNQATLRACGQGAQFRPLAHALAEAKASKTRTLWRESGGLLLSGVVTQAVVVTLITVTGSLAISGSLQPIPALACMGIALQFTAILSAITEGAMGLESRRPMLNAITEVLSARPLVEPAAPAELTALGTVELRGATFGYDPQQPVLRDISLHAPAGSMVAVVGPSGSGKTTLERLISRFYDVDGGEILVGGVPVQRQTTEQLMAQLSMVFQDVYLFDGTLESNIALGNESASKAEIRAAAELAGVAEIVDRLPGGWETPVGEGGRALSGGERQRVALARALLKDAPIVLLDEATSALDVENEAHIGQTLQTLRERATLIVIAHRLDTIVTADRIVLLGADGRIEAQGTHTELLADKGTYHRFWSCLHQAQGWRLVEQ